MQDFLLPTENFYTMPLQLLLSDDKYRQVLCLHFLLLMKQKPNISEAGTRPGDVIWIQSLWGSAQTPTQLWIRFSFQSWCCIPFLNIKLPNETQLIRKMKLNQTPALLDQSNKPETINRENLFYVYIYFFFLAQPMSFLQTWGGKNFWPVLLPDTRGR